MIGVAETNTIADAIIVAAVVMMFFFIVFFLFSRDFLCGRCFCFVELIVSGVVSQICHREIGAGASEVKRRR